MIDALYKEEILEHYKNPQHFGKLPKFSTSSHQYNPFCGDDIELFVLYSNQKVKDISFVGTGCAICIAAASILTEFAKNKTKKELTKLNDEDMLGLLNIEVSESRKKCALLAFSVLKDCL